MFFFMICQATFIFVELFIAKWIQNVDFKPFNQESVRAVQIIECEYHAHLVSKAGSVIS